MFDKETMLIVEIIKATPDSESEDDYVVKSYADLAVEAAKRGMSPQSLERGLNQLPQQGLAVVCRLRSGSILGVNPTRMFRNLFQ